MGFHRQGQPAALNRDQVRDVVASFLAQDLAFVERVADPFLVDHDCINPSGHCPIASCGEIVCRYCAKIFRIWR